MCQFEAGDCALSPAQLVPAKGLRHPPTVPNQQKTRRKGFANPSDGAFSWGHCNTACGKMQPC